MKINKLFEEKIEEKYKEMKEKNISEDFLDKDTLGGIMFFINKKPKFFLFSKKINSDQVYIGSEST